uniref:Phospholipid scramblase n=2 Tax=Tetraselmis sp. GSL018 TaxID=582737 RepID=A0A061S7R1_9CHLO
MQAPLQAQWNAGAPAPYQSPQSDLLAPVQAVMVRQKLQIFEQFCPACEKQNFYRIGVCDPSKVSHPPDGNEFNAMQPSFVAQEDSECLCRFFCGKMREFRMLISEAAGLDAPGQPYLRLERPFRCTIPCCCVMVCPQELSVQDAQGRHLGSVVQDWSCGRCWELACCPGGYMYYAVKGAAGDPQFYLRVMYPSLCNGCTNCCAPTCLNTAFVVDILDADSRTHLGHLKNVFPGFNCRCLADASNLVMGFPSKATPEQRALLLGALFLVEYVYFEKSDNDNSG